MKAEELMIGDWVMYNPNVFIEDEYEPTHQCYPYQIESGEDIDVACEGCYEPIKITKEILEKNGFKEYNSYEYASNKGYCLEGFYINNDFTIRTAKISGSYKLNYVHELQHALRLCGLNKLATNFNI